MENFRHTEYMTESSDFFQKRRLKANEEFIVTVNPEKWKITSGENGFWKNYSSKGKKMQSQGWKVHISSIYENAEETLEIVAGLLLELEINFKHVSDKRKLLEMYSKLGNRVSAGKFITIYPNDTEFFMLIETLYKHLKNQPDGPYILSDKQWKRSNVYFRYGTYQNIVDPKGISYIEDKNGNLFPDKREPRFKLPSFIEIPLEVTKEEEQFLKKEKITNLEFENKLRDYQIEKAIRFSNSGGIYLAVCKKSGKKCVIKEARANIGLDGLCRPATERLENEYRALKQIQHIPEVVKVLDYFQVWENTFLVLEYLDGITLEDWIQQEFPFGKELDTEKYFFKVNRIVENLDKVLARIHEIGLAICDLQPSNIILDKDLNVRFIDFETATKIGESSHAALKTRGFSNKNIKNSEEKDWYALNRIFHHCLLPLNNLFELSKDFNRKQCQWIIDNYGIDNYKIFDAYNKKIAKKISNFNDIFENTYPVIQGENFFSSYEFLTIKKLTEKLKKGILENCKASSTSLINGNLG